MPKESSRSITHATQKFVRETAGSQSLERGLQLLRTFRAGVTLQTNSDLAARSGLPRPTVSRLTRSLVDAGFLIYDMQHHAYRLSAVYVSLADAYLNAAPELQLITPLLKSFAHRHKVNAGLGTLEHLETVYLISFRKSTDAVSLTRRVGVGSRMNISRSALGCAYMAGLEAGPREAVYEKLAQATGKKWPSIHNRYERARNEISSCGYCVQVWEPNVLVGIGTPVMGPNKTLYALNMSAIHNADDPGQVHRYGAMLLQLASDVRKVWSGATLKVFDNEESD